MNLTTQKHSRTVVKRMLAIVALVMALSVLVGCAPVSFETSKFAHIDNHVFQKPVVVDLEVIGNKVNGSTEGYAQTDSWKALQTRAMNIALKPTGGDVLVDPKFEMSVVNGKRKVTVTGYPAKYVNFRTITESDSYWLERLPKDSSPENNTVIITQ